MMYAYATYCVSIVIHSNSDHLLRNNIHSDPVTLYDQTREV
jgi:hypothetical protein